VLAELGHIPATGETLHHENLMVVVDLVRRRRIARLRVSIATDADG